jgi:hypothetical protein
MYSGEIEAESRQENIFKVNLMRRINSSSAIQFRIDPIKTGFG